MKMSAGRNSAQMLRKNLLRGKKVRITVDVDADHAHDLVTQRSMTGIIAFLNDAPIHWTSESQKTVEPSMHGLEPVAAWVSTELVIEMRH